MNINNPTFYQLMAAQLIDMIAGKGNEYAQKLFIYYGTRGKFSFKYILGRKNLTFDLLQAFLYEQIRTLFSQTLDEYEDVISGENMQQLRTLISENRFLDIGSLDFFVKTMTDYNFGYYKQGDVTDDDRKQMVHALDQQTIDVLRGQLFGEMEQRDVVRKIHNIVGAKDEPASLNTLFEAYPVILQIFD